MEFLSALSRRILETEAAIQFSGLSTGWAAYDFIAADCLRIVLASTPGYTIF